MSFAKSFHTFKPFSHPTILSVRIRSRRENFCQVKPCGFSSSFHSFQRYCGSLFAAQTEKESQLISEPALICLFTERIYANMSFGSLGTCKFISQVYTS